MCFPNISYVIERKKQVRDQKGKRGALSDWKCVSAYRLLSTQSTARQHQSTAGHVWWLSQQYFTFILAGQRRSGGGTYPSRKPWPPATSGCRRSWPWWNHSDRSSWWQGRWRSVSSLCHLPHLPSLTLSGSNRTRAAAGGSVSLRNSSCLQMTSRPEEFDAAKFPFFSREKKIKKT